MPADDTARVMHVSSRRRSSRDRRQRTNYRIAIVGYLMAWVAAGIALEWPSTSKCLEVSQDPGVLSSALGQEAGDSGVLETAKMCLPVAALDLLLWTMAGTVIGLVVYYVLRRQH